MTMGGVGLCGLVIYGGVMEMKVLMLAILYVARMTMSMGMDDEALRTSKRPEPDSDQDKTDEHLRPTRQPRYVDRVARR